MKILWTRTIDFNYLSIYTIDYNIKNYKVQQISNSTYAGNKIIVKNKDKIWLSELAWRSQEQRVAIIKRVLPLKLTESNI